MGLPVTCMMVGLADPRKNAKSRLGFIDFIVRPLAEPLLSLFPGLEVPKKYLDQNREKEKHDSEGSSPKRQCKETDGSDTVKMETHLLGVVCNGN